MPSFDERFGVIAGGTGEMLANRLGEIGVKWYIDYQPDPRNAPSGTTHVPFIRTTEPRLSPETIAEYAQGAPGSVWYLGGEPNVSGQTGTEYVVEFDYYSDVIKAADPTAKIMSASILNWDFTCTACGGYKPGEVWMQEFIDAYQDTHAGALPPVDIWAIDTYPLRWDEVPMTDWVTVIQQIQGLRNYLDTELFLPGAPIWVTEIASHWAYSAWTRTDSGGISIPPDLDWDSDYLWDDMDTYLTNVVDWFRGNAQDLNIEKWFFFRDYVDVRDAPFGDPYAGIYFFENDQPGSALNQLGEVYRDYATGRR